MREGKIRYYGLAFEMLCMEPGEAKWYIDIERGDWTARSVSRMDSHFRYVQLPYNREYPYAATVRNQYCEAETALTLIEASRELGLHVIGSMPLCSGSGFGQYTLKEMINFALDGVDAINIGSKNVEHIREILDVVRS